MKTKEEFFQELIDIVSNAGLTLSDYRLVEDPDIDHPLFVDYPAMWFYYCVAGMTAREALLIEYPALKGVT
ncbi:TPA: hypothetical protein ACWW53_001408 [Klebsiella pneumoniae]